MDFDEIFEEYFDRIYYKVLGVVKNPEDAEDISQFMIFLEKER